MHILAISESCISVLHYSLHTKIPITAGKRKDDDHNMADVPHAVGVGFASPPVRLCTILISSNTFTDFCESSKESDEGPKFTVR